MLLLERVAVVEEDLDDVDVDVDLAEDEVLRPELLPLLFTELLRLCEALPETELPVVERPVEELLR